MYKELELSKTNGLGEERIKWRPRYRWGNILFNLIILLFILGLFSLIVAAVSSVLGRGIPNSLESLKLAEVQFSIKLSLLTSALSTFICIIFAIPIAYGLERNKLPYKGIINTIFDIPMALPPLVSGVSLLILFGTTEFGRMLAAHGLKFVFTIKGIVLAQFFVNIPYLIRILRSSIAEVNPRLEFVGRTLGCSRLKAFYKITLPLIKNGLLAGIVITWSRSLGEFGAVLMLAGATRMKTETLPINVFLNMSTGELNTSMVVASIMIIISLISLFIFETLDAKRPKISRIG